MWYTNAPSEVWCIGMYNVIVQVLALGKGESISNEREGLGMNPSGGFDGDAVVNIRIFPSVI